MHLKVTLLGLKPNMWIRIILLEVASYVATLANNHGRERMRNIILKAVATLLLPPPLKIYSHLGQLLLSGEVQ